MMVFCEELAVLHSAFCHANQISTSGLSRYDVCQDSQSLAVILTAVEEVLLGLKCDRAKEDRHLWAEQIIIQMLLLEAANSDPALMEELDLNDDFASAISGMPVINLKLVVDVVDRCHLAAEFLQIIHKLDKIVARKLFYETLQQVLDDASSRQVELLENATMYLSLCDSVILSDGRPSEKELQGDKLDDGLSHGVIRALNGVLMESFRRRNTETSGKVAIVQQLLECWTVLSLIPTHQAGVVLSLLNLIIKSSELLSGISLGNISKSHRESVINQRKGFLKSCQNRDERSLTKLAVCFHNRVKNERPPEQDKLVLPVMLVNNFVEVTNIILQANADVFLQLKRNPRVDDENDILAFISPSEIDAILSASVEALQLKQPSLESNLMSASALESLINALTGLSEEFKSWLYDCIDLSPEERLTLNMYLVKEGLNIKEEWTWIVEQGPQMDPRWLDFLDKHHEHVTCENLLHLMGVLQNSSYIMLPGPYNSNILQQVIVKSFNNLSIRDKNKVIELVFEKYPAQHFVFEENVGKKLTAVFNRITNQRHSNYKKTVVDEVALLALQSMSLVVEKIVQTAVCNGGQSSALIQVLCDLPVLCQVIDLDQSLTLLCQSLRQQFCLQLSKKEQDNGLKFVQLLVQKSLLSSHELMETIVVPYVFKPSGDQENAVPVLFALEVMCLVLETCQECDWLSALKIPPVIYCLCDLIVSSRRKWAEQDTDDEAEQIIVVEKASHSLQCLLDKLLSHMECLPVLGVKWLYQKMAEYPWYVSLQVLKLYDAFDALKLPVILPRNSEQILECEGRTIKMCAEEGDLELCLHMAQASDYSLQLILSSLKPGKSLLKSSSFEKLVSMVTYFLQQSTLSEALRIGEILVHIAAKEGPMDLPVPQDDKFPTHGSDDGHMILWLMKILHYSMLITAKRKCESFSHMTHMARIILALNERYCIHADTLSFLDVAPVVVLLAQAFVHCSLQVAALPEMCEDQLSVLALHILTELSKKLSSCDKDTVDALWSEQKEVVLRCLQLWNDEKQTLFLKKIPS